MSAQAAPSHMRQGCEVDISTLPDRSRVRNRRDASRVVSISACAVGSVAVTTQLGDADDELTRQHHRAEGLVAGTQSFVAQGLGAAHRFAQGHVSCQRRPGQRGQRRKQAASATNARQTKGQRHVGILPTKGRDTKGAGQAAAGSCRPAAVADHDGSLAIGPPPAADGTRWLLRTVRGQRLASRSQHRLDAPDDRCRP